jgi:hypothetical protein
MTTMGSVLSALGVRYVVENDSTLTPDGSLAPLADEIASEATRPVTTSPTRSRKRCLTFKEASLL